MCSVSLVKGIVSGRLSATGSANLGGSSGTTGPGVLVIAWTAARAALVTISFLNMILEHSSRRKTVFESTGRRSVRDFLSFSGRYRWRLDASGRNIGHGSGFGCIVVR